MTGRGNQSLDSVEALLAGAERGRTRVRGFAPWQPSEKSLKLLGQVKAVLAEYTKQLPITVRQIYYRLIGVHGYEKDANAAERLGELINRARRAGLIPMDAIRDDGGAQSYPPSWRDAPHFLESVRGQAATLQLDHSDGQPARLIVMCEAAGMVPQLARVAHEYGVPVLSSGGFDSVTEKHAFAIEIADDGRPTEVLHIGDHDPSGTHMFIALAEDVEAFVRELGGSVSFTRLAVTPQQIADLALETQVKKVSDNRAFGRHAGTDRARRHREPDRPQGPAPCSGPRETRAERVDRETGANNVNLDDHNGRSAAHCAQVGIFGPLPSWGRSWDYRTMGRENRREEFLLMAKNRS